MEKSSFNKSFNFILFWFTHSKEQPQTELSSKVYDPVIISRKLLEDKYFKAFNFYFAKPI